MTDHTQLLGSVQDITFARATEATIDAFPEAHRLSGEEMLTFLSRRRYAVLASTRPDGRPHAAPTGFALVGGKLAIASITDAVRVGNLRQRPYASLVVTEETSNAHAVVMIEGTTRLFPPSAASLEVRAPFRMDSGELPDWIGTFIVLTPERIMSYASDGFSA